MTEKHNSQWGLLLIVVPIVLAGGVLLGLFMASRGGVFRSVNIGGVEVEFPPSPTATSPSIAEGSNAEPETESDNPSPPTEAPDLPPTTTPTDTPPPSVDSPEPIEVSESNQSNDNSEVNIQLPCEVEGNWATTVCWNASYVWVAPNTTAELQIEGDKLTIQGPAAFPLSNVEGYSYDYWNDKVIAVSYESEAPQEDIVLVLCESEAGGECGRGGSVGFTASGQLIIDPLGFGN